jgi:hypothetical protein
MRRSRREDWKEVRECCYQKRIIAYQATYERRRRKGWDETRMKDRLRSRNKIYDLRGERIVKYGGVVAALVV